MGIKTEIRLADSVQLDQVVIHPYTRHAALTAFGGAAGMIWERPAAILVHHPDGTEEILSIQDRTRQAQLLLLGIGFLGSLLAWLFYRR